MQFGGIEQNVVVLLGESDAARQIHHHAVECYCNTFPDIMLTGPSVMDVHCPHNVDRLLSI